MTTYKLISADSHVSEPTDLWVQCVDKKYRDRAPRLVASPADPNGAYFYYEGYPLHPIGIGLGAGKSPEELAQFLTRGTYADARPGGWDPAERLKDNELDGVEADVLYTTLGFRIFWLKDAGLQQDCFRVYNDWLATYCSYAPKRNSITGMGRESQWDFGDRYMRATVLSHEVERSFSVLIFSGVLDRFPELQVVSAENNCGWLPYYLQRMDRTFERGRYAAGFKIQLKPSEYFRRQMHCTYIDDYVGVANRHFVGVDRMMWSSDYPHQASSWPHSQDVVARDFKDASADDRFKITRGNVAKLYGFALYA